MSARPFDRQIYGIEIARLRTSTVDPHLPVGAVEVLAVKQS